MPSQEHFDRDRHGVDSLLPVCLGAEYPSPNKVKHININKKENKKHKYVYIYIYVVGFYITKNYRLPA